MRDFLTELGIDGDHSGVAAGAFIDPAGEWMETVSPGDGSVIARVKQASEADYEHVVDTAVKTFDAWRRLPAPQRGELIRQMGQLLRDHKTALGKLVALEMGKIQAEGEGEVQEMIDIADFALGLSRQQYGLTIKSERPQHRLTEQWHPLGPVGIITAFNFPVAVWAWNAMVASVCGDVTIWKPSPKVPLTAVAVHKLMQRVLGDAGWEGVMSLVVGPNDPIGERLIRDTRIPLISATGSVRMGRYVGQVVAGRLGRSILELGGNNGMIITEDADMDLATRAIVFGAVGTAGQRCTSTRRLLVHKSIAPELIDRLVKAYAQVRIGDPLAPGTLMGPLIDQHAVATMMQALETIKAQGGEILYGGQRLEGSDYPGGRYVTPTLVKATPEMDIVREETFAPILYVMEYESLDDAIRRHNDVPQGLSSAMFTNSLRSAERFLSEIGSDTGIANINIGTSGAEIGGAFGGEKDTGGGRESGSDAWKAYMRRQTQTINWSTEMPLAQGIQFG